MQEAVLVEHLAAGRSLDTIAKLEGRAPSTIGYWLKKHGLEACGSRRFGPKPDIDKAVLERLVSEGLTVPAIAARLGYPASLVRSRLRHHGLQTRGVDNRQRARVAFARGDRQVDLVCAAHGTVPHVLEGRGSYRCMRCRAAQVIEHRRRLKQLLVAEGGGACVICGYARCVGALQFHHVDPAQKSFALSRAGVTRSVARARAEAAKCVVLCANCHAEVESGVTNLESPGVSLYSPGRTRTSKP